MSSKKQKTDEVSTSSPCIETVVMNAIRVLNKMSSNLATISLLPEGGDKSNLQQLVNKQGDDAIALLKICVCASKPTEILRTVNDADIFIQTLKQQENEIASMATYLCPELVGDNWELLLGYLNIASGSILAAQLRSLQMSKQVNSSEAIADQLRAVQTTQYPSQTSEVASASTRQPGWALALAPAANPQDEGRIATPDLLDQLGYAGPPALVPGARENVPADGLCLAYSLLSARDVQRLQNSPRNNFGFVTDHTAKDFKKGAKLFRERACERGLLGGFAEQAMNIVQGEFPEGQALHWYAEELGGSILVSAEFVDGTYVYGDGPIMAHVLNHYQIGEDGSPAPHYLLLQSWMPQPKKSRRKGKRSSSSSTSSSS